MLIRMLNLLLLVSIIWMSSAQSLDNDGFSGATMNGEELVRAGRKLHKPILTIIGMAIQNMHPCEDWTHWSPCAIRQGFFGRSSRSRVCKYRDDSGKLNNTIESNYKLCEGNCPSDFNITTHGYCLKLSTLELTHNDASKQCRLNGGYLINVESQKKYDDVKQMLKGYSKVVYVGGRRKDTSSPWNYEYGSQKGFIIWNSGQPNNNPHDLCLCFNGSNGLWHDCSSTSNLAFVCEVV